MQKKHYQSKSLWFSGLLLSISVLSTGCASLSDYHYEHTQKLRAWSQYRECNQSKCSKHPHDYKKGWLDGFYEVSTGGSCCPPAVAPSCYWAPKQILKNCDNRRHAYYSGWQDGASRASQFPDTHFLKIHETCECAFPRCECPSCGSPCATAGSCQCNEGCQASTTGEGMAYDAGAIESDREIMLMPIPDTPPVAPTAATATAPAGAPANAVQEIGSDQVMQDNSTAEPVTDTPRTPLPAPPALADDDQAELAKPVVKEPKSSSDGQLPPPEEPPLPTKADPVSAPIPTKNNVNDPQYTYDFGTDNSLTINFDHPQDGAELDYAETTVLSDFDIRLDGVGLIE